MEGEKDFDEEPVEALVSQLIKRGDTYKGKFKKLENAVATGKTITTTTGAKLQACLLLKYQIQDPL